MTTFSQLVDELVAELRRPDMLTEVASYLNQTIREAHFDPTSGGVVYYRDNYREAAIVATESESQVWPLPDPPTFQNIAAVRFDCYGSEGEYVEEHMPSPRLSQIDKAYYRAGNSVIFKGYGGPNARILVAWYAYPSALLYFDPTCRPAEYAPHFGFKYGADYCDAESQEEAQHLTTNWMLLRWADVIREGVRAKVYKRLSDDSRARTSYSLYSQLRKGLITSETAPARGYYV